MNFSDISKLIVNGEKLFNIKLRVCYYARVSTDSDIQLNSLENQRAYYEDYICSKSNWDYVGGYIDEGKSGVRVDARDGFKKMIKDAQLGKFDLIITKEVSRFARDLEDSIHYIRLLRDANVGIYFENQNLNTFDTNSELILNIMFNIAQDESRKLSSRIKFGHNEAIKKGHVLGSSNIIGYKKDNCKLIIVNEEAQLIKKVFELYSTGDYGFYKLSKKLGELGFYNKNNNLYDKDTLKRIISNPKYKGFYRGKTTEIIDYRTKKRNKINLENQVIYKSDDNVVPAIVSEELWDEANRVLKRRTKNYANNNYYSGGLKYPFSSKIYCYEHNTTFQRSHGSKSKKRPTWSCNRYLQNRLSACFSPIIAEIDLYNIFSKIINNIMIKKSRGKIVDDMIKLYDNVNNSDVYNMELDIIDKRVKLIENKKSMALDLIFTGELEKEELIFQLKKYEEEVNKLVGKKIELLNQIDILEHSKNNYTEVRKEIENELDGDILEEFIRKFVNKIIVSKINNNRNYIKLDIFLNLIGNDVVKDEIIFLEKQFYPSIEVLKNGKNTNKFIYNVYL